MYSKAALETVISAQYKMQKGKEEIYCIEGMLDIHSTNIGMPVKFILDMWLLSYIFLRICVKIYLIVVKYF
jgi:hypothetical protein